MKRKRVEDLMSTAVVAVKESTPVGIAMVEMDVAGIRHLPVIDDNQRVVGILSNRDVMQAIAAAEATPKDEKRQALVGEIMSRKLRLARPRMPAHEAARLMLEHKIGALPVVDGSGRLVAVLTETDFLLIAERALRESWAQGRGEGRDAEM